MLDPALHPALYHGLDPSHHPGLDPSLYHGPLDPSRHSGQESSLYHGLESSRHPGHDPSLYHGLDPGNSDLSGAEPGVSVQFSPTEFLSATSRLAHLDLEGFERFVGNTFDRAIAGARSGRTKSADILENGGEAEDRRVEPVSGKKERDTDIYVWRDSCR